MQKYISLAIHSNLRPIRKYASPVAGSVSPTSFMESGLTDLLHNIVFSIYITIYAN